MYSFHTLFLLEEYYSPSTGKSYIAEMPINSIGSYFGSNLKGLIIALYYNGNMFEQGIHRFLTDDLDIICK